VTTDRHDKLGIKQIIQIDWMKRTSNLLLAGMDHSAVREELHRNLSTMQDENQSVGRSDMTRVFAVNNLMNIWVTPEKEIIPLRDRILDHLQSYPASSTALYWAMITAVYPFWFNTAKQVGRLLALQDQVTQSQVVIRLKEQYGDRETISRVARYVLRSMVAWGVLKDTGNKGAYERAEPVPIIESQVALIVFEAVLHAVPSGKITVQLLLNHPGLFPFSFNISTSEIIAKVPSSIVVQQFSSADDMLMLKN